MRVVEVMSVRTVLDGVFRVDEAQVRYELPGGAMSEPTRRLSLERGDSAAAVVVDEAAAATVLVRQFRYPTLAHGEGWPLELVAGVVEAGEAPEDCIRREIAEECGLQVVSLHHLCTFYTSPGGSSERIHLYRADVDLSAPIGPGGGVAAEQEDTEVVRFRLDELDGLLTGGAIVDAKTLIGLGRLAGPARGTTDGRG